MIFLFISILIFFVSKFALKNLRKKREAEYSEFLKEFEGKKFFRYTSRRNSKEKIESEILPFLSPEILVVYMNGREPESTVDKNRMIARMLYKLNVIGFPAIIKIEHSRALEHSLKQEIYSLINKNRNLVEMVSVIEKY
ncbi:hypothetical protein A0128_16965 [Leptospira tipperaryensis]|uniref:Uncharacterized protein n=1 Tax=Leptospira tipperaryensis TaxID=2564040 RepID=A0A1D7V0M1_9LEPT|nr:hypothetical protein A0128_16965 [Leptospira tipperaryensis]